MKCCGLPAAVRLAGSVLVLLFGMAAPLAAAALPSLQSYTGLWNMPNARILPDWHLRLGYGHADPYRYYGGAMGLFDRFEVCGQFTEISTITAFADYDYGNYKDRAAGLRWVLYKEDEVLPQIAVGAFDATGTSLFAQRYIVASKQLGKWDLTLGLGQGVLAGEYLATGGSLDVGVSQDKALDFLLSSPFRRTRMFGGIEYQFAPTWTLSAEYSPIRREKLFGYRDHHGLEIYDDDDRWPVNMGIKYHGENLQGGLALLRGDTLAGTLEFATPLELNSLLGWKRTEPFEPGASLRYRAARADNDELAQLAAAQLSRQGFADLRVQCADDAIWVEFVNSRHLEIPRAFGHLADTLQAFLPERVATFYLNQRHNEQIVQSLCLPRASFQAFMEQRLDDEGLNTFADLTLYGAEHR
ncbi:MAG: YjbH domain-containing protein [Deltaproteobacteria bacterium]|nr:YjbH domain-containing protein [Candidatus Anaeroferrophillus wilburensis]MBN2888893.1 YjbH domain-containing protein [Deltaproteobacteria bacterium]